MSTVTTKGGRTFTTCDACGHWAERSEVRCPCGCHAAYVLAQVTGSVGEGNPPGDSAVPAVTVAAPEFPSPALLDRGGAS